MTTTPCKRCGGTENVRSVRPRVACTASTFAAAEPRCKPCCVATKGMFRLMKVQP